MTDAEAKAAVRAGTLKAETLVWRPVVGDWVPAASVAELAALLRNERVELGLAAGDTGPKTRPRPRRASSSGDFRRLVQRNAPAQRPAAPLIVPDTVLTVEADLGQIAARLADPRPSQVRAPIEPVAKATAPSRAVTTIEPRLPPRYVKHGGWAVAAAVAVAWAIVALTAQWRSAPVPALANQVTQVQSPGVSATAPVLTGPASVLTAPAAVTPLAVAATGASNPAVAPPWYAAIVGAVPGIALGPQTALPTGWTPQPYVPRLHPGDWRVLMTQLVGRRDGQPLHNQSLLAELHLVREVSANGHIVLERIGRDVRVGQEGVVDVTQALEFRPLGNVGWARSGATTTRDGPIVPVDPPEPLLVANTQAQLQMSADGQRVALQVVPAALADLTVAGIAYSTVRGVTKRTSIGANGEVIVREEQSWWAQDVGRVLTVVSISGDGACVPPQGCETWIEMLTQSGHSVAFDLALKQTGKVADTAYPAIFDEISLHLPRSSEQAAAMLAELVARRAGVTH